MCECAGVWGSRGGGKEETITHITYISNVLTEHRASLACAHYQVLADCSRCEGDKWAMHAHTRYTHTTLHRQGW